MLPSLPDRVGAPHWGTASVTSSPAGPAGVVFGAPTWWLTGSKGVLAVIGAGRDDYRVTQHLDDHYHFAGEQAVLSPDGRRLASVGRVTDLETGTSLLLPELGASVVVPQAWSPDGRWLAAIAYDAPLTLQPDGSEVPTPSRATLYVLDPGSGAQHRIADLDLGSVHDGYMVAFAPVGARLAYQSARTVTVATLTGKTVSRFVVADGDQLAGKGAWTPDAEGLTLVGQRRCCAGDSYPSRWQLRVVDPATGDSRSTPVLPELAGLVAVRLLGWAPSGEAVVAAFYPEPDIAVVGFETEARTLSLSHLQFTDYEWVRAAKVLAVGPGVERTLLSAPDQQVLSIDVADSVIASGQGRVGRPPHGIGGLLTTLLAGVAVALVSGVAALVVLARRRRPTP
ncbi:hypothetical protein DFJ67_4981 [Asanoa ferruginea]|uniref:WD40 repeat protein n=1 Tax=Asanoa ferruginea TaxID=53367 RepID=A0A3D9ZNK8_9ACTN|nr:hypothetical protein [Asanoa ferruginea]REF98956.1 hypothetical protein DFJ67_4981 [Asanoa ferruginea]GIF46362.1 hypothetical protein Afe04nite_09010 [Asanoa ferruginea]